MLIFKSAILAVQSYNSVSVEVTLRSPFFHEMKMPVLATTWTVLSLSYYKSKTIKYGFWPVFKNIKSSTNTSSFFP